MEKKDEEILLDYNEKKFGFRNKVPLYSEESMIEFADFHKKQLLKIKKRKENKIYSKEVEDCFSECLEFFPEHLQPKSNQIDLWKETVDKLNRIDQLPFNIIVNLVKKTRQDDFWSTNFLSLTKLRKKNREDIMYALVFNEKIKDKSQIKNNETHRRIEQNLKGW
jgi:hypothetical protein